MLERRKSREIGLDGHGLDAAQKNRSAWYFCVFACP